MVARALVGAVAVIGIVVCVFSLVSCYAPREVAKIHDARRAVLRLVTGPRAEGRPIQQVAADLRQALTEHQRLLANRSEWYATHEPRVSERNVHDLVEEAARALGLEPCRATVGTWTSAHLAVRLRALGEAGLVLPQHAWDDRR